MFWVVHRVGLRIGQCAIISHQTNRMSELVMKNAHIVRNDSRLMTNLPGMNFILYIRPYPAGRDGWGWGEKGPGLKALQVCILSGD